MNKESFLRELQSGLAVLAESEQQDILAEYAQHIDMRTASGLTEEEAIRDFGDIRQLTEEILEAYHVNPAYGKSASKLPDPRPTLGRGLRRAGAFFKGLGHGLAGGLARAGRALRALPRRLAARIRALTQRLNFRKREGSNMPVAEGARPGAGEEGRIVPAAGRLLRRLGRGIARLCRLAAWLCWNGALLLCALPFAGIGLLALLSLGVLVVWLTQGLPLAGAALGCAGVLAACAGALGLGSSLIWHRRGAGPRAAAAPEQGDLEEEGSTDES